MKQTKVAANFAQDFTTEEKAQARANIGAAASADIPAAPVQSDWTETNTDSLAYIQNKPTIPASPVQSNWTESNTSSLAYIANKPSLSETQVLNYGDSNPTHVNTLLIDDDDPEGYSEVHADGVYQGNLVSGPYKTLLDSGVTGVGDSATPVYIDGNGQFQTASVAGGTVVNSVTSSGMGPVYSPQDEENIYLSNGLVSLKQNNASTNAGYLAPYAGNTALSTDKVLMIKSGRYEPSWENQLAAGRNLWLNQDNAIQTNLPGGMLAPDSSNWQVVGDFASAYKLMARLNNGGTVDVGLRYNASGTNSTYTFIGKQITTVAGNSNLAFKKVVNINTYVNYTGVQLGDTFDPATLESMTIEGTMMIGTLHDFRVSVWKDTSNVVQVAFTAIEIGKTGATN